MKEALIEKARVNDELRTMKARPGGLSTQKISDFLRKVGTKTMTWIAWMVPQSWKGEDLILIATLFVVFSVTWVHATHREKLTWF